ncbi:MAG TPA: ESX-1 secretion-associated protein [Mycobacterium sp.]|nr:ESX-1 secretion-associated protein [Mycobacterium sp.]
MAENIHVVTDNLREAAGHHQQTAEYLTTIPASHSEIQASLDSLGPIYQGLREAGRQLLDERRQCYESQAAEHAELARNLTTAAAVWEQNEQDSAAQFRGITDDR